MEKKKKKIKWWYYLIMLTVSFGCSTESKESKILVFDIKSIINQNRIEVEKKIGVPESKETFKNKYPCKNDECEKAIYQKGKYEIIYKDEMIKWITINQVSDLTSNDSAIESLGFEYSKSQFSNEGIRRWTSIDGIDEITFFPEYILIIVKK